MGKIEVKFSCTDSIEKFNNIEEVINNTLLGILDIKHKDGSRSIINTKKVDFVFIDADIKLK